MDLMTIGAFAGRTRLSPKASDQHREPSGALRQVLIADQRTATPDTPVCDLSVPLK
jgi:hypothetical protein